MATYKDSVRWIAENDGAGDTPDTLTWDEAFNVTDGLVTIVMVADIFGKVAQDVTVDVLRARGFRKPRGWAPQ